MKQQCWHLFIAKKFKDKCEENNTNIIRRKEAMLVLWRYNIPKDIRNLFLKEMEKMKLIKIKDKQNIKVFL